MTDERTLSGGHAALIAVLAMIGFVLSIAIIIATTGNGLLGTLVGYAAMAGIVLAWVGGKRGAAEVLGLRPTTTRFAVAAMLLGSSYLFALELVQWIVPYHPDSSNLQATFAGGSIAIEIILFAIAAPIAEELLFRGVIMRPLVRRFGPVAGIAITSALFSAYHLSPPQMIPAFITGLALGTLATRTRSLVPGMIAHAVNNLMVVLVVSPETGVTDAFEAHPVVAIAMIAAALAGGLYLVIRAPKLSASSFSLAH